MRILLIKRLWLILVFLPGFFIETAHAQRTVSVVVMPFEIHAAKALSYLQKEIPSVIKKNLEQDGARVLALDVASLPAWREKTKNVTEVRAVGVQNGADYVLWGSLTRIGQQFSLDAELLESAGAGPPRVFTVTGKGIETLPGSVGKLTKQISLIIFKRKKVGAVRVDGNQRIEADAIKRIIKTKRGDIFRLKDISQDLKSIYAMGYFDDVRVETKPGPAADEVTVIFKVKEKPTVRSIYLSGNTVYDDKEIKKQLNLKPGSILNIYQVKNDVNRIEELYKEKNYYNAKVKYKIHLRKHNQADLEFIIKEGKRVLIRRIIFEGNRAYADKELKKQMTTSERGFFSWLTTAGNLKQQDLEQDIDKLNAFYHNHGYINAKVGEPKIEYKGNDIFITIKIKEGPRFKVGKVAITGDLIIPKSQLMEMIKINKQTYYNRQIIRSDILALTDLYSNEGYAYANIAPRIKEDHKKMVVNIDYDIDKGRQVYFERIVISGNTKTRDKVIRRELKVYEQGLYSGRRLKQSIRNLYRLDYFGDIKVNTVKGSAPDKMVLDIDVTEKSTGAFSFGAGYGNVENVFGTASISERNLFGRGQTLSLKGQLGSKTQKVTLGFTEPWLFDIPLSAGFDFYKWDYSFSDYDKGSLGGNLRFSYPIYDFTRAYLTYTYDIADVKNVDAAAARSIKDIEGKNYMSSITSRLQYDSRDRSFNATRGQLYSGSFQFAGLGGSVGFTKYIVEAGWIVPLVWKLIGVVHPKAGYVHQLENKTLPDYEKFYLGGINSMRGFKRDDLAPKDSDGASIGGEKFVQLNVELKFPLIEKVGVTGVLFFDTGSIYTENESIDLGNLRKSAGPEIIWLSPVGPIRLAYGFILDPKKGDHGSGNWEFSMASLF